jgi:hypothetical protein
MPTLKYRRLRGDMIETFKIITEGIFDFAFIEPHLGGAHLKKLRRAEGARKFLGYFV